MSSNRVLKVVQRGRVTKQTTFLVVPFFSANKTLRRDMPVTSHLRIDSGPRCVSPSRSVQATSTYRTVQKHHHQHHYQGQVPWWSIAASTVRCHCLRSWARLHAVCRPMLTALRSVSMVRGRDCLGWPGGRLQWLGNREITAHSALECIHPRIWPGCSKSRRRHLSHRTVGSYKQVSKINLR